MMVGLVAALVFAASAEAAPLESRPATNVVLAMSDDQGWGDLGSRNHPHLETPHLDAMAANGLRFDRFYAAAPVCSPTRASVLTGRHPSRYALGWANEGHLPQEERTLAELLRARGYATGHFGKWHLGTLSKTIRDSNRGGRPQHAAHFSPPWHHGFEQSFSTEARVPTFDPMVHPKTRGPYGSFYWTGPGVRATRNLEGDDSTLIMDRAVSFIEKAVQADRPFFVVLWFHTPHRPVVASPEHLARYPGLSTRQRHYYGALSALDDQMGRLRTVLRALGVADETMLWFSSDNGPDLRDGGNRPGSTGGLRGSKGTLYEGGVRVPGIVEWPARLSEPRVTSVPAVTSDYLPTVLDALGIARPAVDLDGESLLGVIDGTQQKRRAPIAFATRGQLALVDQRYKLISIDGGATFALYDIVADPAERRDRAADLPDEVTAMRQRLEDWRSDCRRDAMPY